MLPYSLTNCPTSSVLNRRCRPECFTADWLAFHADNLPQRMHDVNQVLLRIHDRRGRLVSYGRFVDHVGILTALDAKSVTFGSWKSIPSSRTLSESTNWERWVPAFVAARITIANDDWHHHRCLNGSVPDQRVLVEVGFQPRGLGAPRSAFSGRFGIIVINLRHQRFQMPLHEGAIPIFHTATVIATLQNLKP